MKTENNLEKKTFLEDMKEFVKDLRIPLIVGGAFALICLTDFALDKVFPNYESHREGLEKYSLEKEYDILQKYGCQIDSAEFYKFYKEKK